MLGAKNVYIIDLCILRLALFRLDVLAVVYAKVFGGRSINKEMLNGFDSCLNETHTVKYVIMQKQFLIRRPE